MNHHVDRRAGIGEDGDGSGRVGGMPDVRDAQSCEHPFDPAALIRRFADDQE
jgi:hypothetical protein